MSESLSNTTPALSNDGADRSVHPHHRLPLPRREFPTPESSPRTEIPLIAPEVELRGIARRSFHRDRGRALEGRLDRSQTTIRICGSFRSRHRGGSDGEYAVASL